MGHFSDVHLAAEHSVKLMAKVRIAPEKVAKSRTKIYFVISSINSKVKRRLTQQNVFYVPERQLNKK